jgi:threonine dehydrogenase-like Zn-dependent dehydrogenase
LLLVGAGTIGLLLLQVLKLKNAKNVIVSDLSNFRLKNAKKLGADFTINSQEADFLLNLKKITKDKFIDFSFEAVGFFNSAFQSLVALKKCGMAVWVGNAQKIIEVNMQKIVTTEINIKGSYLYNENDFLNSLKLIEKREINFKPIISLEEKLENGERVFEQLKNNKDGKMIKVILTN